MEIETQIVNRILENLNMGLILGIFFAILSVVFKGRYKKMDKK